MKILSNMFSERLKQFIDQVGISITLFEVRIGVSKGAIAKPIKNQKTVGVEVLEKILLKYPNLNLEWLVSGNGDMVKGDRSKTDDTQTKIVNSDLITIAKDEFIELQRRALRQEDDRIKELERKIGELEKR